MPATSPNSGAFDAALWEARMDRSSEPPETAETAETGASLETPLLRNPYSLRLRRASHLLRDRLNLMEDPAGPLSAQRKRRLSHQTNRLSHIVERLIVASRRYDEEHRREFVYSSDRSAA